MHVLLEHVVVTKDFGLGTNDSEGLGTLGLPIRIELGLGRPGRDGGKLWLGKALIGEGGGELGLGLAVIGGGGGEEGGVKGGGEGLLPLSDPKF